MRVLVMAGAALALAAAAPAAAAQDVGHMPRESPYRELPYRSELSFFSGWYSADDGRANVGPGSGPMFGVRYELRLGGPAQFTARVASIRSERTVLDPEQPAATRDLGTRSWPIAIADVGISLNLTGQRSWNRLVPLVHAGVGIASDFGKSGDPGGFEFGTPFAFTFGTGVRYVSDGRLQLRLDVSDHLYQLRYPDTYFVPPANVPPVLTGTSAKGEYTHNLAVTLGASYLFFR